MAKKQASRSDLAKRVAALRSDLKNVTGKRDRWKRRAKRAQAAVVELRSQLKGAQKQLTQQRLGSKGSKPAAAAEVPAQPATRTAPTPAATATARAATGTSPKPPTKATAATKATPATKAKPPTKATPAAKKSAKAATAPTRRGASDPAVPDATWTVAQLRAEASRRGLAGLSRKSKADLLAALTDRR